MYLSLMMQETTVRPPMSQYRWTICGLIFFATTINYLDRSVISLLKNDLEKTFNWSESDYSNIVIAFQLSYAIGLLLAGRIIDRVGTKWGYALALFFWSFAAMGHAAVKSSIGFLIARVGLGLTEAGNFPAAIKTIAEWFPRKERALATGIFNAGVNIGAIIAPLIVPPIAIYWGWQWAFLITGAIGLSWLFFWFRFYDIPQRQKRLSLKEYDYIHQDADESVNDIIDIKAVAPVPILKLLSFRQTWAFIAGKFLSDPIWWFYLFWLPAFLKAEYGLEKTAVMLPVALVYTISAVGSVFGGWLPLYFIRLGWPVFRARKTSMLFYAICALPVVFAQYLGSLNMWYAVLIIGFATAAHAAWSANIFTTVSDMFPKKTVGSVTGIGGMAGALGGVLFSKMAGLLFDHYKSAGHLQTGYYIMFFICGFGYLVGWLIMHLLVPKMKKVDV
jgi:MFS transporter, ACS family, hexuronate transporter